jgi:hypothetical protein
MLAALDEQDLDARDREVLAEVLAELARHEAEGT